MSESPQIVAIVNVTEDSFSDGGRFLDDAEAGRDLAISVSVGVLDRGVGLGGSA